MEEKYLAQLVEWIQSTSPLLLAAARQKVTANLVTDAIWIVSAVVAIVIAVRGLKWGIEMAKDDDDDTTGILISLSSAAGIIAGAVFLAVYLDNALAIWLAPDYAVIKILTDLAKSAIK